jgi:dinuclear metal center YbgI/SA1388 family protein
MANKGDNIGLQAGHPGSRVKRLMVALDPCVATFNAARAARCDMLVTHHPMLKAPIALADESQPDAALAALAARRGLAVYAAHTNIDTAPGGINDILAGAAGVVDTRFLVETARDQHLKLAAFVPASHAAKVRRAVCGAGAGIIGEYSECSFSVAGAGTFKGSGASNPAVGRAGRLEEVAEVRLEVLLTQSIRDAVVEALRKAHPYEEPAFDLYVLDSAKRHGLGRLGSFPEPRRVGEIAGRMARFCRSRCTQVLGNAAGRVRRVLIWSGGGCPVAAAAANRVELVICGELRLYDMLTLQDAGVAAILLGHAPSEAVIVRPLARMLGKALPGITVLAFAGESPVLRNV